MEADWEIEVGAGSPVIQGHWPGFVDLRVHPERASQLPEATELPALARRFDFSTPPTHRYGPRNVTSSTIVEIAGDGSRRVGCAARVHFPRHRRIRRSFASKRAQMGPAGQRCCQLQAALRAAPCDSAALLPRRSGCPPSHPLTQRLRLLQRGVLESQRTSQPAAPRTPRQLEPSSPPLSSLLVYSQRNQR